MNQPKATQPAEVVSLADVRAKRERRKRYRVGYCGKGLKEECAMRDPFECRLHAPLLRPDDAP
jgi:hypothetical protein